MPLLNRRSSTGKLGMASLALAVIAVSQLTGWSRLSSLSVNPTPVDEGLFVWNSNTGGRNLRVQEDENQDSALERKMEHLEEALEASNQQIRNFTDAQKQVLSQTKHLQTKMASSGDGLHPQPHYPPASPEEAMLNKILELEGDDRPSSLKKKADHWIAELEGKTRQALQRAVTEELKKVQVKTSVVTQGDLQKEVLGGHQQVLQENKELLHPRSCSAIMERMHDWNDCWRRHLLVNNGKPLKKQITCLIPSAGGKVMEETIGAPLYEYAYFAGQGFGRLVEHTSRACMLAFLLKRPCLVNKEPRDVYNTWGSFIGPNTYHWDPAQLHAIPEYANQLEALIMKLPSKELGMWGQDVISPEDYEEPESLVFPMNKAFQASDFQKAIEYYSGTNQTIGNKVLISPNWGDAWFGRVPIQRDIFQKLHGCDPRKLTTLVQNAMYTPSDLGMQLHMERVERADATVWNPNKTVAIHQKGTNGAARTGPHLSMTTGTVEGKPSYGAIHMRTVMMNLGRKGKPPIQETPQILVDAIESCLVRTQQLMGIPEFPENWWFIADNAPTAVLVEEELHKRGMMAKERKANSSLPVLKIFHDYAEIAIAQKQEKKDRGLSSSHSMNKQSTGMFGHAHMAGSIMDWVALHESKVSIVTAGTAYGGTGAQGNGKTVAAKCGELGFSVFIERK